jgi:hypothetical protein
VKDPHPDQDTSDPLISALQRDVARIQEPPFNAALHHAMMRRIRTMEGTGAMRWKPVLAWATALAVLVTCAGLWLARGPQNIAQRPSLPPPDFSAALAVARTVVAATDYVTTSPLPTWMSPTASLLEPLGFSSTNSKQPL